MALQVKPTPTRFLDNILYTPMDRTPMHSFLFFDAFAGTDQVTPDLPQVLYHGGGNHPQIVRATCKKAP